MGIALYGIVSAFIDVIGLIRDAWKKRKEKKNLLQSLKQNQF